MLIVFSKYIYTLYNVVDYYVSNKSTVNLCFLDISKAFDKINHYAIMMKLMQRKLPKQVINCSIIDIESLITLFDGGLHSLPHINSLLE